MDFVNKIFRYNRLFEVLYEDIVSQLNEYSLLQHFEAYIYKYLHFNGIELKFAAETYSNFLLEYNLNVKSFISTQQYPGLINPKRLKSRIEYDIILLFSIILSAQRYRLMELINNQSLPANSALYVGVGAGIELWLTKDLYNIIDAYDLSLNPFLLEFYPDVQFYSKKFKPKEYIIYDSIYLIEILEHLENPYRLLTKAAKSLCRGGRMYLSTATNIPQNDHKYNFPNDDAELLKMAAKIGLNCIFKKEIHHKSFVKSINSKNTFYIFKQSK